MDKGVQSQAAIMKRKGMTRFFCLVVFLTPVLVLCVVWEVDPFHSSVEGWSALDAVGIVSSATASADERLTSSRPLPQPSSDTNPSSNPSPTTQKPSMTPTREEVTQSTATAASQEVWTPVPSVWAILNETATLALPLPRFGDYQCKDQICSEFLTDSDKKCIQRSCGKRPLGDGLVPRCHFMDASSRKSVALLSFPGSGNTWVRGLLEKATGICTGAVYCDGTLRLSGFIGERATSGAVLAVKIHNLASVNNFGSAITIIRNPFRAMIAEWTRQKSHSHTGEVTEAMFKENSRWQSYVSGHISTWAAFIKKLVVEGVSPPVLVVHYEDLQENATHEVLRMLEFLEVPYDEREVKLNLAQDFSTFHRKNSTTFEHFTMSQKKSIQGMLQDVLSKLSAKNETMKRLHTYLLEDISQKI